MQDEKLKSILDIPGWVNSYQIVAISTIATLLGKNKKILEIGAGVGRSTYTWLEYLDPSSELTVIDDWSLDYKLIIEEYILGEEYTTSEFKNKLIDFSNVDDSQKRMFDYVISKSKNKDILKKVFSCNTEEYILSNNDKNYDCVYIDGNHNEYWITMELDYFSHVPIICGDDYSKNYPVVVSVIEKFLLKNPQKKLTTFSDNFWLITE